MTSGAHDKIPIAGVLSKVEDFMRTFLWVRDKAGHIAPFYPNTQQLKHIANKRKAYEEGKAPHFLVLKSRRIGITTWEQGESFHLITTNPFKEAVTLAQDKEPTEKIFRISNMFYERLPDWWRPQRLAQNKREINLPGLNSLFYVGTAGAKAFGRGQTLQRVHGSEVAFWKGNHVEIDNLVAGLLEACSHGEVVLETTANGHGNWYHRTWREAKRGENGWIPLFYPWYEDPECAEALVKGEKIEFTKDEMELIEVYNLTPEQIKWRRKKMLQLKDKFPQEYPINDIEAFLVSGVCFFETRIIQHLAKYCAEPIEVRDNGRLKIWKKPNMYESFVIGCDVGEGVKGGDNSSAFVINRETCEHVASWNGIDTPERFGTKVAELGMLYNKAFIGVESNNHGHSTLNTLRNQLYYPNLYYHTDYDMLHKKRTKLGFPTTAKTRPILLDDVKTAIEDTLLVVNDDALLEECLTFTLQPNGKYEAPEGEHDDRIIASAIAWQIRGKPIVVTGDAEDYELDIGINRIEGEL